MARYYGDIACVKLSNMVHITKNATQCLCGKKWTYGRPLNRESLHSNNIIWRELDAVDCVKCKEVFETS